MAAEVYDKSYILLEFLQFWRVLEKWQCAWYRQCRQISPGVISTPPQARLKGPNCIDKPGIIGLLLLRALDHDRNSPLGIEIKTYPYFATNKKEGSQPCCLLSTHCHGLHWIEWYFSLQRCPVFSNVFHNVQLSHYQSQPSPHETKAGLSYNLPTDHVPVGKIK